MKKITLLFTALAAMTIAQAQINITAAGFTYSQNFNTLDTASASSSSNLPTGWLILEKGTSAAVNNMYKGGDGSSNGGDVYSFGSIGSTERALGSVASGTNQPAFGAYFVNTSTDTIKKVVISFTEEQWRAGGRTSTDTTNFYYSTTATSLDSVFTSWTPDTMLNLWSVVMPSTASALDGNASANRAGKTDSFDVTIVPGGHIYFEWADVNSAGTDDGAAIDDISFTFRGVGTAGVANVNNTNLPLSVLGNATANQMTLGFTATEAGKYNLGVYDLAGRELHNESVNAVTGMQRYTVRGMNLAAGMYIVKLSNGAQSGVTKAIVQ